VHKPAAPAPMTANERSEALLLDRSSIGGAHKPIGDPSIDSKNRHSSSRRLYRRVNLIKFAFVFSSIVVTSLQRRDGAAARHDQVPLACD
jgi:hypothetical protein